MGLEFLRIIETRNNELSGTIPPTIHENSNLRNISFGHNSMNGTIPESFYNAQRLKFLNFADNFFSGTISERMTSLDLLDLSLQNNFFSGSIPNLFSASLGMFKQLTFLRHIYSALETSANFFDFLSYFVRCN